MKLLHRFVGLLLAALFIMFSGILPATVYAAEITEEDLYVFDRDANGDLLYQYQSCYILSHDFMKENGELTYGAPGKLTQIFVYTMHNTNATAGNKSFPTYCTDINTEAVLGANYRRMNLEDSTYSASAAGRIRAILTEGFYIPAGTADHDQVVAKKLLDLGTASGVDGLTASEAIAATQAAIWQVCHGPVLKFTDFFRSVSTGITTTNTKYSALCKEDTTNGHIKKSTYGQITAECDAEIGGRIEAVYNYLIKLSPIDASQRVVSPASFAKLHDPVFELNSDGTYNVSVTTTVDVDLIGGEKLTLKAELGGKSVTKEISNGKNEVTLTIEGVPGNITSRDVTLTLSGYQTATGYFLFDAVGGRDASQTMVGYDNSTLPVYAEVVPTESRSLNIYKSTASGVPISDIVFDIFYVSSFEDSGDLPDATQQTHPELAEYTVITDKNGFASLNFTQMGLPDGVYLIVERFSPKVVAPIDPFYLYVPTSLPTGTVYDIDIYPKNDLIGGDPGLRGGINILKVDFDDRTPLDGAVFEVYRTATENELIDKSDELTNIPGVAGKVLQVPFYSNPNLNGEEVLSVTSNENGQIGIYGLKFGEYYLVEKRAPDGYNLMDTSLPFTIDAESHLDSHTIIVENQKGSLLPDTGGPGAELYTMCGALLVLFSFIFLFLDKFKYSRSN